MISHTCPIMYEPRDLFLKGLDQSTVDKTMERYLGELESELEYRRWAFGHYHGERLYPCNDGKRMLMLYNQNVVDLDKFMCVEENQTIDYILV